MLEKIKQYWMYILIGVVAIYFLFFNKKGKAMRKRGTSRMSRGYSRMRKRVNFRGWRKRSSYANKVRKRNNAWRRR